MWCIVGSVKQTGRISFLNSNVHTCYCYSPVCLRLRYPKSLEVSCGAEYHYPRISTSHKSVLLKDRFSTAGAYCTRETTHQSLWRGESVLSPAHKTVTLLHMFYPSKQGGLFEQHDHKLNAKYDSIWWRSTLDVTIPTHELFSAITRRPERGFALGNTWSVCRRLHVLFLCNEMCLESLRNLWSVFTVPAGLMNCVYIYIIPLIRLITL